jgi:uncharacterized protein YraI
MKHRNPTIVIRSLALALATLGLAACSLTGGGTEEAPVVFEGPPVVSIASPLPNAIFMAGADVNIQARVENAGPDVARVEVRLDDAVTGDAPNPNPGGESAFTLTQKWPASGAGQHTVAVTAYRADGSASAPASVTFQVIAQAAANEEPTQPPTSVAVAQATSTDATSTDATSTDATSTDATSAGATSAAVLPTATNVPATAADTATDAVTPTADSTPRLTVIGGANVRRGPSTAFDPPIGSVAANTQSVILAKNPAGDWYKFQYYNGEGWIFSQLVEVSGDVASLPVDPGPPVPTPLPPTVPPPPTQPPSNVNLELVNIQISPHPLVCQQASEIQVTIRNSGTARAESGGLIKVEAILQSTGQVLESTETAFGPLDPGQQATYSAFLTVSTYIDEGQQIRATVDINNQVAESNESDNTGTPGSAPYALARGSCP